MIFVGKLQRCLDSCNHSYCFNRRDRHKSTAPLLSEQCPGIHCTRPPAAHSHDLEPSCHAPVKSQQTGCGHPLYTLQPSIDPARGGSYYRLTCSNMPPLSTLPLTPHRATGGSYMGPMQTLPLSRIFWICHQHGRTAREHDMITTMFEDRAFSWVARAPGSRQAVYFLSRGETDNKLKCVIMLIILSVGQFTGRFILPLFMKWSIVINIIWVI